MALVWARCGSADALPAARGLADALTADADPVEMLLTLPDTPPRVAGTAPHPEGRHGVAAFLERQSPAVALMIGGLLDPMTLKACADVELPVIALDIDSTALAPFQRGWFRKAPRGLLAGMQAVFARDATAQEDLRRIGVPSRRLDMLGPLECPAVVLPYSEPERQELAKACGNRPLWLALDLPLDEAEDVAAAHRHATRHAHRLTLCVLPAEKSQAQALAALFRKHGFATALRSEQAEPDDATQVFIADLDGEAGLWLRLCPMNYAGGSFLSATMRDPFEAAALGSVTIHGPMTAPQTARYQTLQAGGASRAIAAPVQLGGAVESLLAVDLMAQMAARGWEVTSNGAELVNRVAAMVRDRLDSVAA